MESSYFILPQNGNSVSGGVWSARSSKSVLNRVRWLFCFFLRPVYLAGLPGSRMPNSVGARGIGENWCLCTRLHKSHPKPLTPPNGQHRLVNPLPVVRLHDYWSMTVGSGIEFGIQQTEKVSQSGIGVCVAATNPHRLPHPVMPPKPAQSGKYGCEFRLRKRPERVNLSGSGLVRFN